MALGSTQPLVKMSTRNISWEERRPVLEANNLVTDNDANLRVVRLITRVLVWRSG